MKRLVIFAILVCLASVVAPPPPTTSKQYRTDYEYNSKTNAFYKLHIDAGYIYQAERLCLLEGATLMVPRSSADVIQVHKMMKNYPDLPGHVWVGDDGQKHDSESEETPIIDLKSSMETRPYPKTCDVITWKGVIESSDCIGRKAFVCKVAAADAPYDSHCGVYANYYQYIQSVGSCYGVPQIALDWDQAFAECQQENAHLVVINSAAESEAVKDYLKSVKRVPEAKKHYFLHAGFRANRPADGSARVFKTIFNETLEEAGFSEWSDGEPNNAMSIEYCGSFFTNNGKFNDVDCNDRYCFICEKEVHT